jgi:hypothetical protein
MDWSALVPLLAQSAPTIGGLLGGLIPFPGGAILGQVAGKVLAEALGVPPTPEAIHTAITTGDPATVSAALSAADAKMNAEVEKFKAALEDVQDARATTVKYVQAGSALQLGPVVVSVIVMLGFVGISFLAMKPEFAGVDKSVTLYLLGAWQGLAAAAVAYWIGSSAGSQDKSNQIAAMANTAATVSAKAVAKK